MGQKKQVINMRRPTKCGMILVVLLAVRLLFLALPDEIYVTAQEDPTFSFGVPVQTVRTAAEQETFLGEMAGVSFSSEPAYTVTCRLFGIFPVKQIAVFEVEREAVYASGDAVGIYAKADGVLVVATGAVTTWDGRQVKPAERLLQSGDYIVSVNGETVAGKAELVEKIDAFGEERETIGLLRDGTYLEVSVQPVRCEEDSYKIGVWVRDDLAGVGTLTYYRGDGSFGALGHAISDGDTGELFELSDGSLYKTTIVNIQRGEKGTPGELSGVIDYGAENYLGQITDNTAKGIHGILTDDAMALLGSESYEIGFKQEIKTEAAYIISSVAGERTQYEIQIESVDYHGREENKGILFRVTDERLIALTGGIVQGMSGSPIIQNGKLIGAVTHVLVQDSAKGYGIFIEKMIKE